MAVRSRASSFGIRATSDTLLSMPVGLTLNTRSIVLRPKFPSAVWARFRCAGPKSSWESRSSLTRQISTRWIFDVQPKKGSTLSSKTMPTPHSENAHGKEAESLLPLGTAVKHGRIKQSLAYWCLNAPPWHWDIERICLTAVRLGCHSVELVPPELWPSLRKHGLACALAHNGMPDPVFQKGLNNSHYHEEVIPRTKLAIEQAGDFGVPNVIAFTGYKWRNAEDPTSGEISLADGA